MISKFIAGNWLLLFTFMPSIIVAEDLQPLSRSLAFHASFDQGLDADVARGDKGCYVKQGNRVSPAVANEEVALVSDGRFGGSLHFTKKGTTRPQFEGTKNLSYDEKNWNGTVSLWLRLTPHKDLEPGYCDPLQIIGDDSKKGFIFLEWSKDETPRFFRYAIRPLVSIWNPNNVPWDEIPFEKRPMVQVSNAPFRRDRWTHVAFTYHHVNDLPAKPNGSLFIDGVRQGAIEGWDLRLGWDPSRVLIVLGASYVGYLDDLAVFDRSLTDAEIKQVFELSKGIVELHP